MRHRKPDWMLDEMAELHAAGLSVAQVARIFEVPPSSAHHYIRKNRKYKPHTHRMGPRGPRTKKVNRMAKKQTAKITRAGNRARHLESAAQAHRLGAPMTVNEASAWANMSPKGIREWIESERLKAIGSGRALRILPIDLDAAMVSKGGVMSEPRLGPIERKVLEILGGGSAQTSDLLAEMYGSEPTPAHRATVSRALRTLCEKGYLIRCHGLALGLPDDSKAAAELPTRTKKTR